LQGKSLDPGDDDDDDGDSNDGSFVHINVREAVIRKAWDQVYKSNDEILLFGSRQTNVDLSTLHPEQVQIFRLWQIYLENVNPLFKVTHTPTLQARIVEAASDLAKIDPPFEALMFGIYCIAILSLVDDECITLFGLSREDLLKGYRFGCQQALMNSGFLRSNDRDCLTALFFYLVSLGGFYFANASLTPLDLCKTRYRPPVSILNAWCYYPHRTTHGDTQ
jgi:hypothetical protein